MDISQTTEICALDLEQAEELSIRKNVFACLFSVHNIVRHNMIIITTTEYKQNYNQRFEEKTKE